MAIFSRCRPVLALVWLPVRLAVRLAVDVVTLPVL